MANRLDCGYPVAAHLLQVRSRAVVKRHQTSYFAGPMYGTSRLIMLTKCNQADMLLYKDVFRSLQTCANYLIRRRQHVPPRLVDYSEAGSKLPGRQKDAWHVPTPRRRIAAGCRLVRGRNLPSTSHCGAPAVFELLPAVKWLSGSSFVKLYRSSEFPAGTGEQLHYIYIFPQPQLSHLSSTRSEASAVPPP